jgi:hypothetical protein
VQGDERFARLLETERRGGVVGAEERPKVGERFTTGDFTLGPAQPFPQAGGFGVVTFAQVAVEIALIVNQTARDAGREPQRQHRRLQRRRAIHHREQPAAGRPKPRRWKRDTNAVQTTAFSLGPTSKSMSMFSPV